jgi:prevent-host-death family protein
VKPVKIHEAKTNFSKLIDRVEAGEEIVVQRGEVPVAKIVPYDAAAHARRAGGLKGRIEIAEDFDAIPPGFEAYVD